MNFLVNVYVWVGAHVRFITVHTPTFVISFTFFDMYTHKRTKAHTWYWRYNLQNSSSCPGATANSMTGLYASVRTRFFELIYRVSQEECARLREGVPYVKVYRYYPKHLCPKLNGYGGNGQRKVWSSGGSTHCTCQLTVLSMSFLECGVILRQFSCKTGTVF